MDVDYVLAWSDFCGIVLAWPDFLTDNLTNVIYIDLNEPTFLSKYYGDYLCVDGCAGENSVADENWISYRKSVLNDETSFEFYPITAVKSSDAQRTGWSLILNPDRYVEVSESYILYTYIDALGSIGG